MLWVDPVRDRFTLLVDLDATDNAIAVSACRTSLERVAFQRQAVSFDHFKCKRDRSSDALVFFAGSVNHPNEHFARFDDFTLSQNLDLSKRKLAVDVRDFTPLGP